MTTETARKPDQSIVTADENIRRELADPENGAVVLYAVAMKTLDGRIAWMTGASDEQPLDDIKGEVEALVQYAQRGIRYLQSRRALDPIEDMEETN